MAIKNYTLTEDQGRAIPGIYIPGSENELENLILHERYDKRPNPMIEWKIKGCTDSICRLTLHPDFSLPQHLDLYGRDEDIDSIKQIIEEAFQITL